MTSLARSTVVVVPRERFTPTIESLESLFATVSPDVPVIVVDGGYPPSVRAKLREMAQARPFHHEIRENMLLPNQARNIGTDLVKTEFVAYCDNDIIYEAGWLEALEAHADRTGAEAISPLICIGPPAASVIHHAGGTLQVHEDSKGIHLSMGHNLINRPIQDLAKAKLPEVTESGEFHSIFARTDFAKKLGDMDERLMTREHIDFALRVKLAGGRFGFEPRSVVTYIAKTELGPEDLRFHVFRWNHQDAVLALDAFEDTWGVHLDRNSILKGWIRNHRRRRIVEKFNGLRQWMGLTFVKNVVAPVVEWSMLRKEDKPAARRLPHAVPVAERNAMFADLVRTTAERKKRTVEHRERPERVAG